MLNLDRLVARASAARFALLGEATHDTQKFYALRAEITKRLVTEHGFRAVALAASGVPMRIGSINSPNRRPEREGSLAVSECVRRGIQLETTKEGTQMARSVRDVMTENPLKIEPSESVVKAAQIMRDEDIGSLPVVEQDRLYGVITDRDITTRVVAEESDLASISVRDVASTGPVCVEADSDLDEALRLMAHHQVRRLPVIEDGRLIGVLAQADVAHEEEHEKVGETVEAISDPSTESRR